MGPRQSVEQPPEQQAYMQTGTDMRSTSSGFHFIELHTQTALTAGVSFMLLVAAAVVFYWMMARRARRREAARRLSSQVEMSQMKPSFSTMVQPEVLMELRGMEQPVAVISGVQRQAALGFMPRV
jgi:hypothetical protein